MDCYMILLNRQALKPQGLNVRLYGMVRYDGFFAGFGCISMLCFRSF